MKGGVVLVGRGNGKAPCVCGLRPIEDKILGRWDAGLSGIRIAAQMPFTVATTFPVAFCRAQAPVRSFQPRPTHKVLLAHRSAQACKVAPLTIGCLSSIHSLTTIILHETWKLMLRCTKRLVR